MVSSARHQPPTAVIACRTTAADIGGDTAAALSASGRRTRMARFQSIEVPGFAGLTAWVVCDCDC